MFGRQRAVDECPRKDLEVHDETGRMPEQQRRVLSAHAIVRRHTPHVGERATDDRRRILAVGKRRNASSLPGQCSVRSIVSPRYPQYPGLKVCCKRVDILDA